MTDAQQLDRTAQFLVVEYKTGYGSPPTYDQQWQILWDTKVDRITINHGTTSSVATIWFPTLGWDESCGLAFGDRVRIRTDAASPVTVFSGFVTGFKPSFSGGNERGGAYERNAVALMDHRWLMAATTPIYGMAARGPDDYVNYGKESQQPKQDYIYTFLSGRRTVFNENGKPNRDPIDLQVKDSEDNDLCEIPIFAPPDNAEYWTAGQMIRYIFNPYLNRVSSQFPIDDPGEMVGLDNSYWDKALLNINVDGQNPISAAGIICKNIGWSFREDYDSDGAASLVFYKLAGADSYVRGDSSSTILHQLYAPVVGESIATPIEAGEKMLWAMDLAQDITSVVNNPYGMGGIHRFEFTAELVPGWIDDDLVPDTSESNANLFFTDAALQDIADKNSKDYNHLRAR